MIISKKNVSSVIIIITSVLTLYAIAIKDSYSKNETSTKTFQYKAKKNTYLLKSGKTINLKFNFTWNICDINKLPEIPERIKKRTWEHRIYSVLVDGIRHNAASSNDFTELNTTKNKMLIIRKSNERNEKYGVCVNSLKLHLINGV